uniref:Alkylated DNA repair protein AlkB homologue 8 N-terminal domain-containing protein n=1 Tax=Knipowitschia caucasica TaxID=637954 RepID=A0AAV2IYE9_KNICA
MSADVIDLLFCLCYTRDAGCLTATSTTDTAQPLRGARSVSCSDGSHGLRLQTPASPSWRRAQSRHARSSPDGHPAPCSTLSRPAGCQARAVHQNRVGTRREDGIARVSTQAFLIHNLQRSLCLEEVSGSGEVVGRECSLDSDSQQWLWEDRTRLVNVQTSRCLSARHLQPVRTEACPEAGEQGLKGVLEWDCDRERLISRNNSLLLSLSGRKVLLTDDNKNVRHDSVKLIKFADDTTLIGLISNNDESAYRREVDRLVSWCSGNNLELNAQKTVEMIVDFRKSTVPPPPPSVMDSPITSVESFRFLGTTITQDLKWEPTISSLIKKAQQRMYFLRQLRKAKLPAQMLVQFYTAIIESILTSSVTVWFAGATVRDK